eukprot:Skav219472  [mRNA]  locus=scaffold2719:21811:25197:+ [translate_table: standard]
MLEKDERLEKVGNEVLENVKDFLIRYNIDESAALALQSLPVEQQQEVTGQITRATNPSAVLLSRIKRLKQGLSRQGPQVQEGKEGGHQGFQGFSNWGALAPSLEGGQPTSDAGASSEPPPPPAPPAPPPLAAPLDELRAAVEAFLERHCINADACQSIWELSPEQQRQVISSNLEGDAFDALMDRISEILQGPSHSQAELQKVSEFLARYDISADVALALRSLPLERQVDIVSNDLTGAKNPSAVLMSRIHRKGHGKGEGLTSSRWEVTAFLEAFQFDDDARRSFLELRPEHQNHIMRDDAVGDYRRCRNPSAYLMSRIRAIKESGVPTPAAPVVPSGPVPTNPEGEGWWDRTSGKTDVVETFLRRHNIDDGGREALHQLPAELQLRVLAHDQQIGQGGRNPSQHLVSLVGMAWAGTLGPPAHEARVDSFDKPPQSDFWTLQRLGPPAVGPAAPAPPLVPPLVAPIGAAVFPVAPGPPPDTPPPPPPLELLAPPKSDAPKAWEERPREAREETHSSKKRKLEDEGTSLNQTEHLPLAVEGFLRLNGIDAKSCRAMRRLSPAAQQKLIGMDIRHRRNPSAFLWMQIQKLRDDENDEDEVRPERQRPPPVPERRPSPSQSKPQTSYESYPSKHHTSTASHPSHPSHAPPLPPVPRERSGDVVFFLLRHGKGVPPSVEVRAGAPLTCGRARGNDIEVMAQHVSKRHAEFHVQLGTHGEPVLMIRDLSSNGTWVRGEKIQPQRLTRVVPGDIISLLPPGDDVPAFQVMENADSVKAERSVEDAADGAMAKPVAPPGSGEVSEWIRSIGGGGKLSKRLIEEIEDSYDHLRQISDNYRQNINEFLDVHSVEDPDEQEVLCVAVSALCSWNQQ